MKKKLLLAMMVLTMAGGGAYAVNAPVETVETPPAIVEDEKIEDEKTELKRKVEEVKRITDQHREENDAIDKEFFSGRITQEEATARRPVPFEPIVKGEPQKNIIPLQNGSTTTTGVTDEEKPTESTPIDFKVLE